MKTKENSNLRKNLISSLEDIQSDYLSGMTKEEVAIKYRVSIATMGRFLKEHNITKGRRNLKDLSTLDEFRTKIIELSPTHTVTSICRMLGINHTKYAEIMKISSRAKELRNGINEDFIDMNNPSFCYFLGLFLADGHIDDSKIVFYQSDIKFMYCLQAMMGHTGILRKDGRGENSNYILAITSPRFRELLKELKVDSNKKFTAPYIDCGMYSRDFVRGVFDGDGCITYTYTSGKLIDKSFNITSGSYDMIYGISKFLESNDIEHTVTSPSKEGTYYRICINAIPTILKVFHLLYDNTYGVRFDKKFIKFIKFESLVKMNQKINDIVETNLKELDNLHLT